MGNPAHIAFIMDGNGRWASRKGLPRSDGHAQGAEIAEATIRKCSELGIRYVTLFAFSTENWKRPAEEIQILFGILAHYLLEHTAEMISKGVRIRFLGKIEALPEETQSVIYKIQKESAHCDRLHMILAINYGGRQEICDGFLRLHEELLAHPERKEILFKDLPEKFTTFLYLPDVPPPDLIVRTSGEKRLSNFLLWQCAYSEFYFTDTLWPDFDDNELLKAIQEYSNRKRRFGGLEEHE